MNKEKKGLKLVRIGSEQPYEPAIFKFEYSGYEVPESEKSFLKASDEEPIIAIDLN